MSAYEHLTERLKSQPHRWLVTGAAGFIGSHLVETLLKRDQVVVGLDNFATGKKKNLEQVKGLVSPAQWARFSFVDGDIRSVETCQQACLKAEYVLHQAALGSVPRSIVDPLSTHDVNVNGTVNMLLAARDQKVRRFVYASSSAVYGDHPDLPKVESKTGKCLSPYAVSKQVNELYAEVFGRCYGLGAIGLRYFNVFGQRQDPEGEYAAVIPRWIQALMKNEPVQINGDGETSRDFCYVANVVEANLLAATSENPHAANQVYNVALQQRTTLNQLFAMLRDKLSVERPGLRSAQPVFREFRAGDVRHSEADISRARNDLGFAPRFPIGEGLDLALGWYLKNL